MPPQKLPPGKKQVPHAQSLTLALLRLQRGGEIKEGLGERKRGEQLWFASSEPL